MLSNTGPDDNALPNVVSTYQKDMGFFDELPFAIQRFVNYCGRNYSAEQVWKEWQRDPQATADKLTTEQRDLPPSPTSISSDVFMQPIPFSAPSRRRKMPRARMVR